MSDKKNEEEIIYEDEESSDKSDSKLQKVKKELKQCQAEKQEYLDGWQRSKADYVNLKKNSEDDKERIKSYANEDLILELITVLDSFEMAFKDQESWNNAPENWRKGIEYIYNQFTQILDNYSVKTINPLGEDFDPNIHNCSEMLKVEDESKEGKIIEVLQKGYQIKDKLIRVPTVKVGEL